MNKDSLGINETVVEDALIGMLEGDWALEDTALENCRVRSFQQTGLLTRDKGVLITLPDGSEFQLTITRRN